MTSSLFSSQWYRVADHQPALRTEVRVQRQLVRGERWYLLVDTVNGRQYRINDQAFQFIGRCDGNRSVADIWGALLQELRDEAPTQDDVIAVLNRLHAQSLLVYGDLPDVRALVRHDADYRKRDKGRFVNPFALRIRLGDPSRFLRRLDPLARVVFNRLSLWLWIAFVGAAALAAAGHWRELSMHATDYMGTPRYLVLAAVCFPCIKMLHELAHALALRRWNGETHEVGFSLFVLMPCPYVDASSAAAFRERSQRMLVGGAGMLVELLIAAIALVVWLNVQPGVARDVAFVTIFIASVSTMMFNANPLLAFDGYYILCDALELPNWSIRSKAWWTQLLTRVLVGETIDRIKPGKGERKWLMFYAPASFAYRIAICYAIVLWLGGHSALLAYAAAALLLVLLVLRPVYSIAAVLWRAGAVGSNRTRVALASSAGAVVLACTLCFVPLPFYTLANGLVWPSEQARVRAGSEGFVQQVLARDGERVSTGQPLVVLHDPVLLAQRESLGSRIEQLQHQRFSAVLVSADQVRAAEEEIARAESELQRVQQKIDELNIRAGVSGTLVLPHEQDLAGAFVRQGSTLGYVLDANRFSVRAVIPEYDVALVRSRSRSIDVRVAGHQTSIPATLVRDIPAATYELPSAVLGDRAGGPYATDPQDKDGLRTREPVIVLEVTVPAHELQRVGARAWVRFDHGREPLASRWYRELRHVFLQHLNPAV